MSATPSQATIPSTTSSPSAPPNGTNASTLLFGFLVSALTIFAVFMSFAIIWNRLIARRHAIDAMLATSPSLESWRLRRPPMWDIWAMPDKKLLTWQDIKPLAAQKCDCLADPCRTTHTEQVMPFWRRHLFNRLPPEITYLFHTPIPPAPSQAPCKSNISLAEVSRGSDIRVSLLIAMPHASLSTSEGKCNNDHMFHEVVFATTNVLYHDVAS